MNICLSRWSFCFVGFWAFTVWTKRINFWIQTKTLPLFSEAEEIKNNLFPGRRMVKGRLSKEENFCCFHNPDLITFARRAVAGWGLMLVLNFVIPVDWGLQNPSPEREGSCSFLPSAGQEGHFSEGTALGHLALNVTCMGGQSSHIITHLRHTESMDLSRGWSPNPSQRQGWGGAPAQAQHLYMG